MRARQRCGPWSGGRAAALALLAPAWLSAVGLRAQIDDAGLRQFEAGAVTVDGVAYAFRLLAPLAEQRAQPLPLVVFLHGSGERGDDNRRQLYWLGKDMVRPEWRRRYPCWFLAVQCPKGERWVDKSWQQVTGEAMDPQPTRALRAVQAAVAETLARRHVDRGRVYLTGLSMGGMGAWELAMRDPATYAAVLPICGGGDPREVHRLIGVPIDAWHGADDAVVPVERTRELVDALTALGFPPRYHELPGVKHDAWKSAYGEQGGLDWLFAQDQRQQRRGAFAELAVVPRCDAVTPADGVFELGSAARVHAPAELRELVRYLFDALELRGVRRPGFVDDVPFGEGDLAFGLDAALPVVFSLEVSDRVRLTARDVAGLRQGLAALHQAWQTLPGLAAPRGVYARARPLPRVRVELQGARFRWSREALVALLRECFLGGVQALSFGAGEAPPFGDDERAMLAERAALLGIELDVGSSDVRPSDVGSLDVGADVVVTEADTVLDVLRREPPAGVVDTDVGVVVRLKGEAPDVVLRRLRPLLPAAVERADRWSRPVHYGSFVSRVGTRWR